MSRVIWKGSISFGLVHVPIGLYAAESPNELHLSMLDNRDMSPVGYKRINKSTGEDVSWGDIVKGYEYEKGEYIVLGEEDFRQANVEATQTVEIVDFVDAAEIPLPYYDKPYYLEPMRKGEKGYALLREALRRTRKVGIAKVVLRSRERLAALLPWGEMLVLELLRYADELRDPAALKVPGDDLAALRISDKELDMAERLIDDMVVDWQPQKYHDAYRDDLMRLIDEKVRHGELKGAAPVGEAPPPPSADVVDIMSLLKKSVEQKHKTRAPRSKQASKDPGKSTARKTAAKPAARKKRTAKTRG